MRVPENRVYDEVRARAQRERDARWAAAIAAVLAFAAGAYIAFSTAAGVAKERPAACRHLSANDCTALIQDNHTQQGTN